VKTNADHEAGRRDVYAPRLGKREALASLNACRRCNTIRIGLRCAQAPMRMCCGDDGGLFCVNLVATKSRAVAQRKLGCKGLRCQAV